MSQAWCVALEVEKPQTALQTGVPLEAVGRAHQDSPLLWTVTLNGRSTNLKHCVECSVELTKTCIYYDIPTYLWISKVIIRYETFNQVKLGYLILNKQIPNWSKISLDIPIW